MLPFYICLFLLCFKSKKFFFCYLQFFWITLHFTSFPHLTDSHHANMIVQYYFRTSLLMSFAESNNTHTFRKLLRLTLYQSNKNQLSLKQFFYFVTTNKVRRSFSICHILLLFYTLYQQKTFALPSSVWQILISASLMFSTLTSSFPFSSSRCSAAFVSSTTTTLSYIISVVTIMTIILYVFVLKLVVGHKCSCQISPHVNSSSHLFH